MEPEDKSSSSMGQGMTILAWISFFVVVGLFFHEQLQEKNDPNRSLAVTQGEQLILKRNRAGHYLAPGSINGIQVQFLLDSGATWLSIPSHIANKAGLTKGPEAWVNTANGEIKTFQTLVDEVSLAGLTRYQVRALINPADHQEVVLLGMNFLKHYEWHQSGDTLVLTPQ